MSYTLEQAKIDIARLQQDLNAYKRILKAFPNLVDVRGNLKLANAPTEDLHAATKAYVDANGITDHGGLSGLGDDDHPQYNTPAIASIYASLPGLNGAWAHATIASYPFPQVFPIQWTTDGATQPSIGNGTLDARYLVSGRICMLSVGLWIGSTTNTGSGNWQFSLPVPCGGSGMKTQYTGVAHCRNSGIASYERSAVISPETDMNKLWIFISPAQGTNYNTLTATHPFTWGANDSLTFSISYEVHNGYGM